MCVRDKSPLLAVWPSCGVPGPDADLAEPQIAFLGEVCGMKVGVLTFHSQTNYGGLLQAVATRCFLQERGHEVVFANPRARVTGPRSVIRALVGWIALVVKSLFRGGDWGISVRRKKTSAFIASYLPQIEKPMTEWRTRVQAENIDVLVVGSDQVWNSRMLGPKVVDYLPCGLRELGIRLIAYAASVGMPAIPDDCRSLFKTRLPLFDAISVRERLAAEIVQEFYQGEVRHVCDPTLLIPASRWEELLELSPKGKDNYVFCYALDLTEDFLDRILQYSGREHVAVKVFSEAYPTAMPRTIGGLMRRMAMRLRLIFSRVQICRAAGPREFVQGIRDAQLVLADSFHALMFATIFDRPVRIVVDQRNSYRVKMAARVVEFASQFGQYSIVLPDWGLALADVPCSRGAMIDAHELAQWVYDSKEWLSWHVCPTQEV